MGHRVKPESFLSLSFYIQYKTSSAGSATKIVECFIVVSSNKYSSNTHPGIALLVPLASVSTLDFGKDDQTRGHLIHQKKASEKSVLVNDHCRGFHQRLTIVNSVPLPPAICASCISWNHLLKIKMR